MKRGFGDQSNLIQVACVNKIRYLRTPVNYRELVNYLMCKTISDFINYMYMSLGMSVCVCMCAYMHMYIEIHTSVYMCACMYIWGLHS